VIQDSTIVRSLLVEEGYITSGLTMKLDAKKSMLEYFRKSKLDG